MVAAARPSALPGYCSIQWQSMASKFAHARLRRSYRVIAPVAGSMDSKSIANLA